MPSSPSSSSANKAGLGSELESFRRQWLSDIQHQHEPHPFEGEQQQQQQQQQRPAPPAASTAAAAGSRRRRPSALTRPARPVDGAEDEIAPTYSFDDAVPSAQAQAHARHEVRGGVLTKTKLVSALDHYEEAMAKEAQGNMGDSLKLYRIAYRMDNGVDRRYREKHFPKMMQPHTAGSSAITTTTPNSSSPAPTPSTPANADADSQPLSIKDLIASFASLQIEPVPPEVEGMPAPPCPLANLPDELLVHILLDVAVADVADFARLSRVCKRLAYLVATEQRIWRRVALGPEFGLAAMLYRFERGVSWEDLDEEERDGPAQVVVDGFVLGPEELARRRKVAAAALSESLTPAVYPTWKSHFRSRPRVRFNGCYISTVNYVRSGVASTNSNTWGGSPIHIVTYYRYLRFFRDGSLISLLTTQEPADVVHHLARRELYLHRDAAHKHLPSAVMALALKGRWRLSSAEDPPMDPDFPAGTTLRVGTRVPGASSRDRDPEGDVFIETEGVGEKYMYRMDLSLRSHAKAASRNNKLTWRGFYSYNKLTDDWAEFGLKNDKPFFFSRVKSYGFGE